MAGRSTNGVSAPVVAMPTVCAAGAGMLAAWVAAGSTGLLAHPLRIALTWLVLAVSIVAVWPWKRRQRLLLVAIAALAALPLVMPVTPMHDLLVVLAVVALLAAGQEGLNRTVLLICAESVLTLVVFRSACVSGPIVWTLSDAVGAMLGRWAATMTGRPLNVGATFGGLDYLVLMSAFCGLWLWNTREPRRTRGACAAAAILGGHLVYLIVLAFALDIADLLPETLEPKFDDPYVPPDWCWFVAVKGLLPWNVPAIAAVIHLATATLMLRWAPWRPEGDLSCDSAADKRADAGPPRWRRWSTDYGALGLAVLLPIAGTLSLGRCDLSGKMIVASGHDELDWSIPQHDRYGQQSAGRFGMLPVLVNSLGGQFRIAPELSDEELADADVVLLLHPAGPVPAEQRQRLLNFVRSGGSLLVAAGPSMRAGQLTGSFNGVLQATGMSVRQDVAISKTSNWQHVLDVLAHSVTAGTDGREDCTLSDLGASIDIDWPARPLVVGRWGWSDPGSDAVLTSVSRFEEGERLGDLVLAAQQPFGNGTIIVLGDSSRLTNEGGVRGYALTGRLLSHLANRRGSPQTFWRQFLTTSMCVGLLVLVVWRPCPQRLTGIAVLIAVSLAASHTISRHITRVVPDGRVLSGNQDSPIRHVAYIDGSHVEPYSSADWTFDSIDGLALTLTRNGYLTLSMAELTRERLKGAAVFVSIAPSRRFSAAERTELRDFVQRGGLLICTVGAEEASASESLLADFGIRVPASPVPTVGERREPEPMGNVRSLFLDANAYGAGDYRVGVVFHAGWPVHVVKESSEVLAYAIDDQPIVVCRQFGQGRAVVIGDTNFAMNKNLEYVGGEPFNGRYENAHFWRWLISRITERPEWIPPKPPEDETIQKDAGQEGQP